MILWIENWFKIYFFAVRYIFSIRWIAFQEKWITFHKNRWFVPTLILGILCNAGMRGIWRERVGPKSTGVCKHNSSYVFGIMAVQYLSDIMTITLWQNRPKLGPVTVSKFHFITLELSPCENYWPVTIIWMYPEVVTISDKHCTVIKENGQSISLLSLGFMSLSSVVSTCVNLYVEIT